MEETPLSFKVEFKGEGDETVEIKVSLPGMTEVPEIQDISEIQEISDIQEGQESKASSNEESEEDTEEGQQDRKDEDEKDDKGEDVAAGEEEQFSDEDLQQMMELSLLSPAAMIAHIQGLEARMFELSQREARELNRSKHLRIFGNSRRRASK
ncbi:hypothetical protein KR018_003111 [Drosophila ironensis]|nr:hypothetical protein KR018_003111 [Drosophila ironensis]